jgi:hypothetical protein
MAGWGYGRFSRLMSRDSPFMEALNLPAEIGYNPCHSTAHALFTELKMTRERDAM